MTEFEGQSFRGNVEPDNLARIAGPIVDVGSGIEHLSELLNAKGQGHHCPAPLKPF
jgi:hypothetical protein